MNSTDIGEIHSVEISLHKGGNFIYLLNGVKIRFWISLYNGIEKLFVGEKFVSKKDPPAKISHQPPGIIDEAFHHHRKRPHQTAY